MIMQPQEIANWHKAMKERDASALDTLLADDVRVSLACGAYAA